MKRPWDAIVWWEVRRAPYNVALAILGVITISVVLSVGSHFVAPGEDVEEPLGLIAGAVLYGLGARITDDICSNEPILNPFVNPSSGILERIKDAMSVFT